MTMNRYDKLPEGGWMLWSDNWRGEDIAALYKAEIITMAEARAIVNLQLPVTEETEKHDFLSGSTP